MIELLVSTMLHGHCENNDGAVKLMPQKARLDVRKPEPAYVQMHISAIGIRYTETTGYIEYIDPASDVYGRIHIGDTLISTAGEDQALSAKTLSYFGNENTICLVVVQRGNQRLTFKCKRKPIELFERSLYQGFLQQLRP